VLAYEPAAVVSHWSAAAHWGLLPARRGRVEVIVPSSHERVGTRRHRLRLAPGDKTVRGSVPVTSVGRTLADIATVASREALARAVHEAQVRRLLPHPEIERAISRSVNRHSARELRWLLAEVQPEPRLRSELERRFLTMVVRTSLPAPRVNALVEVEGILYEVDFSWPRHRVAVELDGEAFQATPRAREADYARDARFRRAGWQIQRFTWHQVATGAESVMATVAALLGAPSGRSAMIGSSRLATAVSTCHNLSLRH